jgi:hypothetical protein
MTAIDNADLHRALQRELEQQQLAREALAASEEQFKAIYEPWDFFGFDAAKKYSADVVCTGEEYIVMELLERLMEYRAGGENLRKTFHRLVNKHHIRA